MISVIALIVSLYEANILKDQQRALVWPYFGVGSNFSGKGFSFVASNNGTGPALIKSMEVIYEDSVYPSFEDILDKIKPDRVIGYDRLRFSNLNNTVVKPGEERAIFNMPWDDETREMASFLMNTRIKVQYCSVLGDCWVYDSADDSHTEGTFKSRAEFQRN